MPALVDFIDLYVGRALTGPTDVDLVFDNDAATYGGTLSTHPCTWVFGPESITDNTNITPRKIVKSTYLGDPANMVFEVYSGTEKLFYLQGNDNITTDWAEPVGITYTEEGTGSSVLKTAVFTPPKTSHAFRWRNTSTGARVAREIQLLGNPLPTVENVDCPECPYPLWNDSWPDRDIATAATTGSRDSQITISESIGSNAKYAVQVDDYSRILISRLKLTDRALNEFMAWRDYVRGPFKESLLWDYRDNDIASYNYDLYTCKLNDPDKSGTNWISDFRQPQLCGYTDGTEDTFQIIVSRFYRDECTRTTRKVLYPFHGYAPLYDINGVMWRDTELVRVFVADKDQELFTAEDELFEGYTISQCNGQIVFDDPPADGNKVAALGHLLKRMTCKQSQIEMGWIGGGIYVVNTQIEFVEMSGASSTPYTTYPLP